LRAAATLGARSKIAASEQIYEQAKKPRIAGRSRKGKMGAHRGDAQPPPVTGVPPPRGILAFSPADHRVERR
jgi:hypothetical protein